MSQAEPNPGTTQQRQKGSGAKIDLRCEGVSGPDRSAKETAIMVIGSTFLLITLWIAVPLTAFAAIAFAQGREDKNTVPGVAALPSTGAPSRASASAFR